MHDQCLDRVRTTAGREPAARWQRRRNPPAVETQHAHQRPNEEIGRARRIRLRARDCHGRSPEPVAARRDAARGPINRRSAASRSAPRAALLAPAAAGNARTTTRAPAGTPGSRERIRCRSRRCTRCRTTEQPTGRPTTKPIFGSTGDSTSGGVSPVPTRARCTTTEPQAARRPRRTAVANSSRRVSRVAADSKVNDPRTRQADNSMRPLRRRAAMMARPARVRMRNRNPWVLARRRLFGWNVRLPLLTAVVLPVLGAHRGSQPSGLQRSSRPPSGPGDAPARVLSLVKRGEGAQECPPVGGRRPEPRPTGPVPSKQASRVTVRATRRYIGGACLRRVLVAAPQAC